MKTEDQITQEFKAELSALLKKYNAELSTDDHWDDYPELGQDVRMSVYIPPIYDEVKKEYVQESANINLGKYFPL